MSLRHEVDYLGSEPCGADVVSARFSRPPGFAFAAGQWMILALTSNGRLLSATFTICSAPSDDYLEITTRLSGSEYKNALLALSPGDRVMVTGPGGRLALPVDEGRPVFLVGGVGITPVRSMLRQAAATGHAFDDALLVYGNRDASCVPFEAEFAAMTGIGVRMVLCYEHPPAGWTEDAGFITAQMVSRYLPSGVAGRTFLVAGPPIMVSAMEQVLDGLSVPEGSRLVERFGPRATVQG